MPRCTGVSTTLLEAAGALSPSIGSLLPVNCRGGGGRLSVAGECTRALGQKRAESGVRCGSQAPSRPDVSRQCVHLQTFRFSTISANEAD